MTHMVDHFTDLLRPQGQNGFIVGAQHLLAGRDVARLDRCLAPRIGDDAAFGARQIGN